MRPAGRADPIFAAVSPMLGLARWTRTRSWACAVALLACPSTAMAQRSTIESVPSFIAGSRDVAGRLMGGTEMRALAAHGGRLFAGNGYWEDRPGPDGTPGAQILVLDGPSAEWRVDAAFDDRLRDGRRRHLAISALSEATFRTDGRGTALPTPARFDMGRDGHTQRLRP